MKIHVSYKDFEIVVEDSLTGRLETQDLSIIFNFIENVLKNNKIIEAKRK